MEIVYHCWNCGNEIDPNNPEFDGDNPKRNHFCSLTCQKEYEYETEHPNKN
jgi:DNA-directed RNA polymerase subunit RPC12/RpoP